jgi:hypothetical protein
MSVVRNVRPPVLICCSNSAWSFVQFDRKTFSRLQESIEQLIIVIDLKRI